MPNTIAKTLNKSSMGGILTFAFSSNSIKIKDSRYGNTGGRVYTASDYGLTTTDSAPLVTKQIMEFNNSFEGVDPYIYVYAVLKVDCNGDGKKFKYYFYKLSQVKFLKTDTYDYFENGQQKHAMNYSTTIYQSPNNSSKSYVTIFTKEFIQNYVLNRLNESGFYDFIIDLNTNDSEFILYRESGKSLYYGYIYTFSDPDCISYHSQYSGFNNLDEFGALNFRNKLFTQINTTIFDSEYYTPLNPFILTKTLNFSDNGYYHAFGEDTLATYFPSVRRLTTSIHPTNSLYKKKLILPKFVRDLKIFGQGNSANKALDNTNYDDINDNTTVTYLTAKTIDEIISDYRLESFIFNANFIDLSKVKSIAKTVKYLDLCGSYGNGTVAIEDIKRIFPNITSLVAYELTYNGSQVNYREVVQYLPNLKSLVLLHNKSTGTTNINSFPNLERLIIGGNSFNSELYPYHITPTAINYNIKQLGFYSPSTSIDDTVVKDARIIFQKFPNLEALNIPYYEDLADFRFYANPNIDLIKHVGALDFSQMSQPNTTLKALGVDFTSLNQLNRNSHAKTLFDIFPNLEYLKIIVNKPLIRPLVDYFGRNSDHNTKLRFLAIYFNQSSSIVSNTSFGDLDVYLDNLEFLFTDIYAYQDNRVGYEYMKNLKYTWGINQFSTTENLNLLKNNIYPLRIN